MEWIEVFWHDFWVFAARRLARSGAGGPAFSVTELIRLVELRKTFFELPLLDCDFFGKYLCQLFVKEPKFLKVHGFEILPSQHSRHRSIDA